jgi:hypothetical protein
MQSIPEKYEGYYDTDPPMSVVELINIVGLLSVVLIAA